MNNGNTQRDSEGQQQQTIHVKQRRETHLSIEVVILLVGGLFFLLYGLLLFPINTGALRYSPDSTDGLFLVLVSLQIITMGRTPLGDLRRSWMVVIVGIGTAVLGSLAIFTPGHLTVLVRILAGVILLVGGVLLLVQLFTSEEKAKTWLKVPGILQQLTVACGVVYVLEVLVGILALVGVVVVPGSMTPPPLMAVPLLIFGVSLFYLAWCIQIATNLYRPEEIKNVTRE
jgi:hypothetical protein